MNDNSLGKKKNRCDPWGRGPAPSPGVPPDVGPSGTPQQKEFINSLTAPLLGVPVDQMSDPGALLFGPAMAGTR